MIADIPTGFDQWQWTQMPVANNTGAKAYFLQNPKIPDWELLKDFYPYCDRNKFDFWLCQIENKNWTFFKGTDDTWVLSKIITTDIEGAKLVGPFFVLSQTEQNGKEVWKVVHDRFPLTFSNGVTFALCKCLVNECLSFVET